MNNSNNHGKWAPFATLINSNTVLKEINEEKTRINRPVLSEEQISELENIIIESYINHVFIEIIYYKNSHAYKTTGIISKINPISKKITLNNQKNIFFYNIIRITKKTLDF